MWLFPRTKSLIRQGPSLQTRENVSYDMGISGIQASLFFLFLPTLDIANKYFLVMCFPISKMIITTVDKWVTDCDYLGIFWQDLYFWCLPLRCVSKFGPAVIKNVCLSLGLAKWKAWIKAKIHRKKYIYMFWGVFC